MILLPINDRGTPTLDATRPPRRLPRRTVGLMLMAGLLALGGCRQSEAPTGKATEAQERRAEVPAKEGNGDKKDVHGGEEHGLKLSAEESEAAGIRVEELIMRTVADQVVLTATIHANQDRIARLSPRVPARLARVAANLGDPVRAGQILATLDSIEVGEAQSAYRQAKSQFALSTADFERAGKLKADEIIPEKDFLRTRSDYEKAKAALRAAESRLQLLGAAEASDAGTGSLLPLRAPFAGTVIEKKAVLGELAQPDKTLFTVADLSTLWIEANLFEKDLGRVRLGAAATVTVGPIRAKPSRDVSPISAALSTVKPAPCRRASKCPTRIGALSRKCSPRRRSLTVARCRRWPCRKRRCC